MKIKLHHEHPWDVSPTEAVSIQKKLAGQVKSSPLPAPPRTLAGVDVSIQQNTAIAAIVVIDTEQLNVLDRAVHKMTVPFPYIPGLLSFREMPAILPALEKLSLWPDLFLTDSQGIAHPRRFGLACHLGVMLDHPCFGVAKTRFIGTSALLGVEKGSMQPLFDKEERIGTVVRTRSRIKPVYVSIGHRITLHEAEALTLALCPKYKIPEPLRLAHNLSYTTNP